MIVDSSAVTAVIRREPGFQRIIERLGASEAGSGISAPNLLETTIVLTHKLGRDPRLILSQFLREARITVVPFAEEHATAAADAFMRFGKGRHPAALNFGDCIAYATAKLARMPLLYLGEGFARTDIDPA